MYEELLVPLVWILISGMSGMYLESKVRAHSHRIELLQKDQKSAMDKLALLAVFEETPPTRKQSEVLMQHYKEELKDAKDRELKTRIFRKEELNSNIEEVEKG